MSRLSQHLRARGVTPASLVAVLGSADAENVDGERLARHLDWARLSVRSAARRCGITARTLRRYAVGHAVPTLALAEQIADGLGIEPDEVFDRVRIAYAWPPIPTDHALTLSHRAIAADTNADIAAGTLSVGEVLATKPTRHPCWRDRAACAGSGHDPDLWWPEDPRDPALLARRVCAGCPVVGDCRDAFFARRENPDGIWAGVRGHQLLAATRPDNPAIARLLAPTHRSTGPGSQTDADPPHRAERARLTLIT